MSNNILFRKGKIDMKFDLDEFSFQDESNFMNLRR